MTKTIAPYGQWDSPVTSESFTARSVTLSQVRIDGSDTYWVEGNPAEGGRNTLLRRGALGAISEILPLIDGVRLPDVRTRVHEYGGRAYAVLDGLIVFSDGFDGRVYAFNTHESRRGNIPLTPLSKVRYGDFEIDEVRGLVYAVAEDHSVEGEPVNSLVAIPLDGSAGRNSFQIRALHAESDFVAAPALSPDGSKLAWLSWNHPDMPWTRSALHVASLDFAGHMTASVTLVDQPEVCVYEPRWTLSGELIHVDDSTGWANLFRTEGFTWREGEGVSDWTTRLRTRPLHPGERAFSHPHWRLGLHSFDNLDHEYLVCSWAEDGIWHIGTVRLDNGMSEEWPVGWWPIGNVASQDGRVVFLADSATHSPAIVEIKGGLVEILRSASEAEIDEDLVSSAQQLSWQTRDGESAHGFYYPPCNPAYEAPEGTLPPLLVNVHGGPTASAHPGLQIAFQYWTSRGYAVLDVNYRGSTGYGRTYRERLNGQWGKMDVEDCIDGVNFLVEQRLVDPSRVAIRGASSGGLTVLMALVSSDVFTAGTSFYGVADLVALPAQTHKFESQYAYRLIGSDDLSDPVWQERSPLNHVENIHAPLLMLQGDEDRVVPLEQAQAMHRALTSQGKPVSLKVLPGEGHGFRSAENITQAWETERSFYSQIWGFNTDSSACVIENF